MLLNSFNVRDRLIAGLRMSPASVLITGANRGIGLEFVRQYAQLQPVCPSNVFAACRAPESAKVLFSF